MAQENRRESAAKPLLSLSGVHTHIGHYHILAGVDLQVYAAEIVVLLGRNGVGKSTTLRTIMHLWQASKGNICFDGSDITKSSTSQVARRSIAYVPEDMGVFSKLTVQENMHLAAREALLNSERLDWILTLFPTLQKYWQLEAGNLSGGQKQMLAIARAIVEPRKLLIIDEPSKGLAPAMINQLISALQKIQQENSSILLVEQNLHLAQRLADHVYVMDEGRIVHSGAMSHLLENKRLQQQLLGLNLDPLKQHAAEKMANQHSATE